MLDPVFILRSVDCVSAVLINFCEWQRVFKVLSIYSALKAGRIFQQCWLPERDLCQENVHKAVSQTNSMLKWKAPSNHLGANFTIILYFYNLEAFDGETEESQRGHVGKPGEHHQGRGGGRGQHRRLHARLWLRREVSANKHAHPIFDIEFAICIENLNIIKIRKIQQIN